MMSMKNTLPPRKNGHFHPANVAEPAAAQDREVWYDRQGKVAGEKKRRIS